jgi:raffinose/stachyose/melibiose transport system substrate-binding protein
MSKRFDNPVLPEVSGMIVSHRHVRWSALIAAAAAVALAVAGCGSGGGSSSKKGGTLKLWHYEGADSAMGIAWNEAIREFKASHPGVTVKFEAKGFEQIRQNAPMILNSGEAPDVMEYNKGNASAGLLSKQNLLTDLTPQVHKYGWDKMLSSSLQTTARYSGGVMGSGKWYGIPNYGEYVMVYYNKDLFTRYNVQVPTTLSQFEAAMDTFVHAGVTPLSVGAAEYPAQQIFYELALSKAKRSFVDDYQLYKKKVNFHGPELTFAANTYADWVSKGYIAKSSSGVKAEDMGVAFEQGKFPMMISGSWWYGRFTNEIKNYQWGTFLFPGNKLQPGSSGNIWVVPSKAKNKSLAYDFINITMKPKVQDLLGNSGGVPVKFDASKITDQRNKELLDNWEKVTKGDELAFYPDWPAAGYYDVMVAGVQNLTNGKNPNSVLDDLAKPYNDNLSAMGK